MIRVFNEKNWLEQKSHPLWKRGGLSYKIHLDQAGTLYAVLDGKCMQIIGLKSGNHSGFHSGWGWKILL